MDTCLKCTFGHLASSTIAIATIGAWTQQLSATVLTTKCQEKDKYLKGGNDKESNDSYFNYAYMSVQIHTVLTSRHL